jgi:hypothetical protein
MFAGTCHDTGAPTVEPDDILAPEGPLMDADADCPIAVAPVPACGTE